MLRHRQQICYVHTNQHSKEINNLPVSIHASRAAMMSLSSSRMIFSLALNLALSWS